MPHGKPSEITGTDIEQRLSAIGTKIIKASEQSYSAVLLCRETQKLLTDAQMEIADLYNALGHILPKQESQLPPATPKE